MSRRSTDPKKSKHIKLRLAVGALALSALFGGLAQVVAQPAVVGAARLALVIGEASYRAGPISSAANDAGLVADTLQQAGFDVTGAADLDQEALRKSLREFVEKAASAGPDAVVFIYLSGRAVQYAGENYLAPIEASIPQATNVPLEAVRLNDYLQPLSLLPLKARIFVLDAARANAFAASGAPLAGGLALVEPNVGGLYAFNAAPDTVAPDEKGPYGVYAQSLTEMMREGGLPLDEAFARTRLRVSERTKGAQVPWDESKLSPAPVLFARAANAPAPAVPLEAQANLRVKPIRDFPVDEAFAAALEQDTISAYVDFLNAYPNSRYAARVRAMLAMRREAVTWRRAYMANTANAYWTYLQRYRNGPHAEDARRRLMMLNAALMPPPQFEVYEFDVPPPVDAEDIYFRRHYVMFDDDDYGPPPQMSYLLPPPPMLIEEAPPPSPRGLLPLPLVAAPLLFAIPAVRHGLFHAPAVVQQQQPAAQNYYGSRNAQAPVPQTGTPGAPGGATGAPARGAPAAPAAPGTGTPLPHQGAPATPPAAGGGGPLPHQGGPATPPAGAPHMIPPVPPTPGQNQSTPSAPAHATPSAPGHATPQAPAHVAPPASPAPVHAPPPHPAHVAPPAPHAAPVHVAPPPAHVHAAPPPVHAAPPPVHAAPPAPVHAARPPAPVHVASPPHPAAPPQAHAAPGAARPAQHPHCGAHGEPPCH